MGISSVFSRIKMPKKEGKTENFSTNKSETSEFDYLIQILGFEGEPTYELTSGLTFGSESADVLIEDEAVSPRHCSFILNQDVVLLMDHASTEGTYIGKMKLSAGKSYIISEDDKIKIADIELKLIKVARSFTEPTPKVPVPKVEEEVLYEEEIIEEVENLSSEDKTQDIDLSLLKADLAKTEDVGETVKERKKREKKELKEKKKKEKKLEAKNKKDKIRYSSNSAANALIRVLSLVVDLSIAYFLISLYGQEEISLLMNEFIPLEMMNEIIFTALQDFLPNLNELFATFSIEAPKEFLQSALSLYCVFFVYRLLTTFLFKVTLGQLLLGLKVEGHPILKRVLGFLREAFFMLLSPLFLLTHLGTLLSKRSLEEVITGTRIEVGSSLKTTILTVLVVPLTLGLVLISPLLKNFDFPEHILFTDNLSRPQTLDKKEVSFSKVMKIGSLDSEKIWASGTVEEKEGKKLFFPELIMGEGINTVSLQLKKTFLFPSVLKILFSQMYLNTESFSGLRNFANSTENANFQTNLSDAQIMQMGSEFNQMMGTFLNPELEKIPEILFQYGPLFQSIMDFRGSINTIAETNISEIELTYFGKTPVVILKSGVSRNGFLFFPLGVQKTPLYQVTLKSNGNMDQGFVALRSQIFNGFIFKAETDFTPSEKMFGPDLSDELAKLVSNRGVKQEKIFEFYFRNAKKMIKEDVNTEVFLSTLDKTLRLIDKANSDGSYSYLYQSLSEVKNAVSGYDLKYFDGLKNFKKNP